MVSASASGPGAEVLPNSIGIFAACTGCQMLSPTEDEPTMTAATFSSTIRFPQSVPFAGSASASHLTSRIGRPAIPPRCALSQDTVASATRLSYARSETGPLPSETIPIRTGVPLASSAGPSSAAVLPADAAPPLPAAGLAPSDPSEPQAASNSTPTDNAAVAVSTRRGARAADLRRRGPGPGSAGFLMLVPSVQV